jgi:Uncharacterized protein conserved in bacteria
MKKITPFLWFNGNAEEAIHFYTSVFKNSKVVNVRKYGDAGPGPKGTVMTGTIELEGQEFMLLNGGPEFSFTPAISFFVNCKDQNEVDELWNKLLEGGKSQRCGWIQDKFGLSWQIIPEALGKYLSDKDPVKSGNVMKAMMKMDKIIVKDLDEAYNK